MRFDIACAARTPSGAVQRLVGMTSTADQGDVAERERKLQRDDVRKARCGRPIGAARASEPPPAVIRATENLKLALRLKLQQDTLTSDQSRVIARALDEAAAAIEQA